MSDDTFKNALPREVDDYPDSGMPRQLRTQADNARPLERDEAAVAGIAAGALGTYGDDSLNPNADDRRDTENPEASET